jgi:hypothetical protein
VERAKNDGSAVFCVVTVQVATTVPVESCRLSTVVLFRVFGVNILI